MNTPTVIVEKIQIRRGRQIELPGKPVTLEPLLLSEGLAEGEMGLAVDTGRLFIGHNPRQGDINFQRAEFPYRNLEILTENSPRTKEMFSEFLRDQDKETFFLPTVIGPAGEFVDFEYNEPYYSDGFVVRPTSFELEYGVVTFEIAAFVKGGVRDGWAAYNGRHRFILNGHDNHQMIESVGDPNIIANCSINFRMEKDGDRYWKLMYNNFTNESYSVYIRRVIVNTPLGGFGEEGNIPL